MGFHSLEIGKSGLIAANYGLQITGQNITNATTAGYSRQTLSQTGSAYGSGYGTSVQLGAGVSVRAVTQVVSAMAEKQLRQATSGEAYYNELSTCYTNLQSFFNELSGSVSDINGNALSDGMNSFWNSMKNLSAHVETLAQRSTVIDDAVSLTTMMNDVSTQLREYRSSLNAEVKTAVNDVNGIINNIAALNKSIVLAENGGLSASTANDLRDERGELLRQLSELIDIDVTNETNGSVIVSTGGRNLVYYDQVYELAIQYEKKDDLVVATPVFASDTHTVKLTDGKLAALVEERDVIIKGYIDELDQLAGAFTWEFNRVYSQGRGDDSYDTLTSQNAPLDSAVTLDQLEFIANVPDGTFQIVNGNLQVVVHNRNTGEETTVNIEIDLDGRLSPSGEPDMILWDPANPTASNSFVNRLQKALDEVLPGGFTVSMDNLNYLTISSNSSDYGFCFGEDTSGILAALGLNTFFTGFGADTIGVNEDLAADPASMAVSTSFNAGDNQGVLNLIAFSESEIDRLGGMSPDEYYQNIAGRLASEASRTATMQAVKCDLKTRMFNQRESVSGVNEDEETIKLMAYQRAFQSASKFISVVDELYETLINM